VLRRASQELEETPAKGHMKKPYSLAWIGLCGGVLLGQYLAVRLGLLMGIAHGNVSPVWPATGFAIAVLLRFGVNLWPGVALGSFLGLMQTGVGASVATGEAAAALLEGLTAVWLVRQWIGADDPFSRTRDVIRFCIVAGGASTAVSATVGVGSLCLWGVAPWTSLEYLWGTWWLGDVMGALIVAPFLMTWLTSGAWTLDRATWTKTGLVFALLILAGVIAFWGPFVSSTGVSDYPVAFLTLPMVVSATFLAGRRGATAACVICSAMAISGTARGLGPFFRGSVNESLLLLQSYLVVISVTATILAAVLNERDWALDEVRRARDDLDNRIAERTQELLAANAQLKREMAERKQAEEGLRESEDRYRNFFATSRDGVFMTTLDGQFFDVNAAALEMWGYGPGDREKTLLKNVADFYAKPEERTGHIALVSELGFSKEYPVDLRKKDGTIVHTLVTTVPRRDSNGAIIGFQGSIRDITERKQSEEVLRNTVQRFHTMLSSLYSGVLIVTEEGSVELANQAFCDMFDLDDSPASLTGLAAARMIEKIRFVYANPAEALARIREVVATQQSIKGEEIAIRDDRTYIVDFVPIFVDGRPCGRLWHHTDITSRKRAEREKARLVAELRQALAEVKKLSGFLPICASCKKIRDDQGYWRQVEEYIRDHSEAEFSHSICPECAKRLYPDFSMKRSPTDKESDEHTP
jgi:PAS domain S-box-containing protein